ncbi:MAG: hypothetical protein PF445_08740 [Melioribacteraceae bacterium]|jgi:hypothetical protein|nr:hypothetical protein [Melioribacteraceae bacterium]
MKNRFLNTIFTLAIIALIGFLVGLPYLENTEIEKEVALFKRSEKRINVSSSFKSKEFKQLPSVVKNYLQNSIKNKSESPKISEINIVGKTRSAENENWIETKTKIYFSLTSPAFIETAETFEFFPLWMLNIKTYLNNTASTRTKLLSSIPLNNFAGNKLNRSYIILYLMESAFSPTVLLPNRNVQWKWVNPSTASAIIWNENLKGSAIFHFNSKNEVTKIVSKERYMPGKLDYTKETFTIHLANYKDVGDYYIPTYFEVQWNLVGNDFTFGRFQITDISYE